MKKENHEPSAVQPVRDAARGHPHPAIPPEIASRAMNPSCLGSIPQPDGYAYLRGDCGDSLEVFLQIRDRRIHRARFDALGCEFTVACGNLAMELAEGKTLSDAMHISPEEISRRLGGVASSHVHCTELAADAVKKAVEDYLRRGKETWKKLYRTRTPGST